MELTRAVLLWRRATTFHRAAMDNADLARIINSTEVQSVLRPKIERSTHAMKRNALKNKDFMEELNPGSTERKASLQKASQKGTAEFDEVQKNKKARIEEAKKYNKENKKGDETFYKTLMKAFEAKAAADAAKKAAEKAEEEGEDEEWALGHEATWLEADCRQKRIFRSCCHFQAEFQNSTSSTKDSR